MFARESPRRWIASFSWLPLGVNSIDYDPNLTEEDIYHKERDIDVIYVGTPSPSRVSRVMELKKRLNIRLYGGGWQFFELTGRCWPFAIWLYKRARWMERLYPFQRVKKATFLPRSDLIPTYQRTKIGINIHLSYGPSNMRMYQLLANGVMQICDCPEGLGQVFEVGKEVVVYHSVDEAVKLIKYYLEHDDERKEIAAAGFRRVMQDYKRVDIFSRAMEKIKRGMVEDGIKYFKDETPLEA